MYGATLVRQATSSSTTDGSKSKLNTTNVGKHASE